jgi:SAM-dependent methyltransferase
MNITTPPLIFDPKRQQAKLDRAAMRATQYPFLWHQMASDIADRLAIVSRNFDNILLIGPAVQFETVILGGRECNVTKATFSPLEAASQGHALIEGDLLPFDTASFDLAICIGMLESLNDLPGFLIQLRHILKPDGLFLGSIMGAGSLSTLKSLLIAAEGDRVGARLHPQIELKTIADLIVRAGFALPVADQDELQIRYSHLNKLLSDLRDMGVGNALSGNRPYIGKSAFKEFLKRWVDRADTDGKVIETFTFLHLLGWAPSDDRPKAARRGSGKVSLAEILPFRSQ